MPKQRAAIKLTKEEAKELLASDRTFVQKRLHPDRFSLGLSFITFILIFFGLYVYFELFDQARILPPYEPVFYTEVQYMISDSQKGMQENHPKTWTISDLSHFDTVVLGELARLDYNNPERKKWLLCRAELLYLSDKYEETLAILLKAQSNFPDDAEFVNHILWMKGFLYYEQDSFAKSARVFHQLVERKAESYQERAQKYSEQMYSLVEEVSFIEYIF